MKCAIYVFSLLFRASYYYFSSLKLGLEMKDKRGLRRLHLKCSDIAQCGHHDTVAVFIVSFILQMISFYPYFISLAFEVFASFYACFSVK